MDVHEERKLVYVEHYSRVTCMQVLPHQQAPMIAWTVIELLLPY